MWWLVACTSSQPSKTEVTVQFQVDTDPTMTEIRLAPYDPNSSTPVGDIAYTFSGEEATAGISWESPDSAYIIVIDSQNAPDMKVATFVPGLWENDVLVGVGEVWPSWIEGTIPDLYAQNGIIPGWNGIYINEDHTMSFVDPLAIEVHANQRTVETLTFEGTAGAGAAPWIGVLAAVPLASVPADSTWSFDLTGAPADSEALESFAATGLVAPLLGFEDTDGSGGYSSEDTLVHGVCSNGAPVIAGWLDPVEDLSSALERFRRGYQSGWNAFITDPSPLVTDSGGLVAEASCAFPG